MMVKKLNKVPYILERGRRRRRRRRRRGRWCVIRPPASEVSPDAFVADYRSDQVMVVAIPKRSRESGDMSQTYL
jgi:hypothetical protein